MNIQEFLDLHLTGAINFAGQINVLYEEQGDNTGEIVAMTVTRSALSVDGSTLSEDQDIYNILPQIETIAFTFDGNDYLATVDSFTYYNLAPPLNSFFLFVVSSVTLVPDTSDTDLLFGAVAGLDTQINFSPIINQGVFDTSDYNPLFNNGNFIRRSSNILEADREIGSLQAASAVPSNFSALLSTSASKAQVQDSFYTDTGLINARYNGSKATPANFSNISPSLSANEFIGDIHPGDSDPTLVCVYNNTDRVPEPLLHTGPNRIPGFTTSSLGIQTDGILTSTVTTIDYTITGNVFITPPIDPGDILFLKTGIGPIADFEKVKVVNHNAFTKKLVVQRGYLFTTAGGITPSGTDIYKVERTDIYKIDDFVRNLSAIESSIVYEKESHSLLFTDPFGLVYSQSFCPQPVDATVDLAGSDRRLKFNINLIGKSPSNINIYSFEYKDKDKFGYGTYQGVMSDEILSEAVVVGSDGYDRVNYSLLDVEFKKLRN